MATILLVDDVQLFLELEKSFLEDSGHQVVTASSGEEALELLEKVDPALVLMDLYMAGMDGDEACRRIRSSERWRALPVIMVTSAGKEEEVRRCLDAGCDDYLTKPVNKKVLVEKVARLLGSIKGRVAPRKNLALRVQIKGEGKSLSATAANLSRHGIYVKSGTKMAPGAVVDLNLDLPDGRQIHVLGKVKRVKEGPDGGMGIYFIHPEPQGKKALEQLAGIGPDAGPPKAEEESGELFDPRVSELESRAAELKAENRSLHQRIAELEAENGEFAQQIVHTEEINNNLTNLYIASSRLHEVLRRVEVVEVIKEVVINFVGAEKFALLLYDQDKGQLCYETGEGYEDQAFPALGPDQAIFSEVARGEDYFKEGSVVEGSDDPFNPIAAIPLRIHGRTMGVLAIYRLFVQKECFEEIDYQLFSMLAEHAATALFSSGLYESSERKRETYKGFMDLLLK